MYKCEKEQKLVEVAGVRAGGQPGEFPTLIFGELFFQGDVVVKDPVEGVFDHEAANSGARNFVELCQKTGVQGVLAVMGDTPKALIRYVDWLADLDFYDGPIAIDAPNELVRLPAVAHAAEIGLAKKLIYDSVHPDSPPEEFVGLKEHGVKYSVAMASNSRNMWPEGRIEVLEGSGTWAGQAGLLKKLENAGVEGIFIDTAIFGAVETVMSNAAVKMVKEAFGWPVGAGTGNAIEYLGRRQREMIKPESDLTSSFKGVLSLGEIEGALTSGSSVSELYKTLDLAYALSPLFAGSDYLWGISMAAANYIIPAVAAVDAMLGYYYTRITKGKIADKKNHPLYKFMK